jgi:hypothetical protein
MLLLIPSAGAGQAEQDSYVLPLLHRSQTLWFGVSAPCFSAWYFTHTRAQFMEKADKRGRGGHVKRLASCICSLAPGMVRPSERICL